MLISTIFGDDLLSTTDEQELTTEVALNGAEWGHSYNILRWNEGSQ